VECQKALADIRKHGGGICLSSKGKEDKVQKMEERKFKGGMMEYKKCRQSAKRVISSAKEKKHRECASGLNDPEHQNAIFRMANQMVKERQDITGSNCLKGVSGKVTVDEKGIKDSWKEYMEKLMNEENE